MTITPDCATALEQLQTSLRGVHRGLVRNLRLETRAGGVEISGEAISYYAIQLVIRDVLAAGVRRCRSHLRVRPTVAHPTPPVRD